MDLMPNPDAGHLVERRRQDGVDRFARDQHAGLRLRRVEFDSVGRIRDTVAENRLIRVERVQRRPHRTVAAAQIHDREQHAAGDLAALPFLEIRSVTLVISDAANSFWCGAKLMSAVGVPRVANVNSWAASDDFWNNPAFAFVAHASLNTCEYIAAMSSSLNTST